tara:strand:- start:115 stop:567 length:453 start_codon:yes stop_codon:yes gene_type:complete
MEQTNLVVTPDGKTWDEVTRDVSYIGNVLCEMTTDTTHSWDSAVVFDEWRGEHTARTFFNKDFAIAYDRLICLVPGRYKLEAMTTSNRDSTQYTSWSVNETLSTKQKTDQDQICKFMIAVVSLQRGDSIKLRGDFGDIGKDHNIANITRL